MYVLTVLPPSIGRIKPNAHISYNRDTEYCYLVLLNHVSVCLFCTRRRGSRGSDEEGEEEEEEEDGEEEEVGEEYIHGRCHKIRDSNILPGLKFGKYVYIHNSAVFLHIMLCTY